MLANTFKEWVLLNKEFRNYVMLRCIEATEENIEFKKLEKECDDEVLVRTYAEELCYRKGFYDALKLAEKCSQKV